MEIKVKILGFMTITSYPPCKHWRFCNEGKKNQSTTMSTTSNPHRWSPYWLENQLTRIFWSAAHWKFFFSKTVSH
jgi:hypothetical protein